MDQRSRTRRESTSTGTRREGVAGASGWVSLPAELADRFTLVRELSRGGEGLVVVVDDQTTGGRCVLKGYHRDLAVETESIEALVDADPHHVVQVLEHGLLSDGSVYEVLEFIGGGSLRELMRRSGGSGVDLKRVAAEVAAALDHIHGMRIVHRDVKPENILVKHRDPLDLVLGDFGLVRHLTGSVRHTTRAGTAEYLPPEAIEGEAEVTPAWDWWSLGMVLAEIASGVHPLALPDGSLPPVEQMRSELAQRPVDLADVDDRRVRHLCAGLLVRDRRMRWGWTEVSEWLAGGLPALPEDGGVMTRRGSTQVYFRGEDLAEPQALAAWFQSNWRDAMAQLFQERDPVLREELVAFALEHGRGEVGALLESPAQGRELPRRFAQLLIALDPALAPVFDGVDVTPPSLERAAQALASGHGDDSVASVLEVVRDQSILRVWRHLPGMADAGQVAERWQRTQKAIEAAASNAGVDGRERRDLGGWSLLLALDERHGQAAASQLGRCSRSDADLCEWWAVLADRGDAEATAVALVTHPRAAAEGAAIQEKRRQEQVEREAQDREEEHARLAEEEHARLAEEERRRPILHEISVVESQLADLPGRKRKTPPGGWFILIPMYLFGALLTPVFGNSEIPGGVGGLLGYLALQGLLAWWIGYFFYILLVHNPAVKVEANQRERLELRLREQRSKL